VGGVDALPVRVPNAADYQEKRGASAVAVSFSSVWEILRLTFQISSASGTVLWMLLAGSHFLSHPKSLFAYLLCGLSLASGLYFLIVIVTFAFHFKYTLSMQIFTWVVSTIAMVLPMYGPPSVLHRITSMAICFSIPFTMMSLSYENLFFLFFFVNVVHWLRMEAAVAAENGKETVSSDKGDGFEIEIGTFSFICRNSQPIKTYLGTRKTDRTGILWRVFGCCLRNSPLTPTNFERTNLVRPGKLDDEAEKLATVTEKIEWWLFLASLDQAVR
jgi:Phosphatidylinositolglycan class N (PIG-N)